MAETVAMRYQVSPSCIRAAARVFRISIIFVTGPVPPGTGVIAPAIGSADA
jgi:hypothetical protein